MDTKNYIVKDEKTVSGENYEFLRSKGLEYIKDLSSKIWTDYNIHDPGITILEVLCYAITDITYRCSFNMEDLLTGESDQGGIAEFYTAREILTCNPVTVNDFRKLLIDVEGVKNAWLKPVKKQDPEIYINCKKSELSYDAKEAYKKLILDGLYNISLELDEDLLLGDLNDFSFEEVFENESVDIPFTFSFPLWDHFFSLNLDSDDCSFGNYTYTEYVSGTKVHRANISIQQGGEILNLPATFVIKGKRNLVNEEKIKTHLSTGGAEILTKKYLAKISAALAIVKEAVSRMNAHRNLCEDVKSFSPIDVEEIKLCASIQLSPEVEIEKVYAQILFEVGKHLAPDVLFYSLKDLLEEGFGTDIIFEGPALDHGFIKEGELLQSEIPDEIHVSDIINIIMDIEGVLAIDKIQLGSYHHGLPVVKGEKWNLLPGENRAPRLRADLADLTFYKGLIPYDKFDSEKLDLYYQELLKSIRTAKLRKDKYDYPLPKGQYLDVEDYISIQEEFPLVYGVGSRGIPGILDKERISRAKQLKAYLSLFDQLLMNYLSQLRHLSDIFSYEEKIDRTYFYQFPYQIPEVYKLLEGFTGTLDKNTDIDKYDLYSSDWESFMSDPNNEFAKSLAGITESEGSFKNRRNRFLDHLMARFAEQFNDYALLMYEMDGARAADELIADKSAFLRDYVDISSLRGKAFDYTQCKYRWTSSTVPGKNVSGYTRRLSRLTGIENYLRRSLADDTAEGFHLIEHILLRPPDASFDLMPVCVDPDCKTCIGFQDPYSFRMTLVLPAWADRFTNMNFRRHFEATARLEAPAQVHVKICWVDPQDMLLFERAFKRWLGALCKNKMTPAINNKMIAVLNELNSVYPEAILHDCEEDGEENPIILGQTNIGSE